MLTVSVLFAISCHLIAGGTIDLPSYIPKCSLSDPKLSECLVKSANEAIPFVAKGDASYGILPLSPVAFTEVPIIGTRVKYIGQNAYTDDWKKLRLTEAVLDLENGRAFFVGVVDKVEVVMQNYTIIDGKILNIPVYGHGKHNFILEGVKINFHGGIRFYKKGEDEYIDFYDTTADVNIENGYFYFENIKSPETAIGDVNDYIKENGEDFFKDTKSVFDDYLDLLVNSRIKVITNLIPFNKIFLP